MKSIIQTDDTICYLCGMPKPTDWHHVYNGSANRRKSEADLIKIKVHRKCHEYIHSHELTDLSIKARCQDIWCEYYHKTDEDFIERYGINYKNKYQIKMGGRNGNQYDL